MAGRTKRHPDEIDRRILDMLSRDSKQPVDSVAREIGLSRSATNRRIINLEKSGIIRRYTIAVGRRDDRNMVEAFFMLHLGEGKCLRILPVIAKMPEVIASYSISGEIDMVLHVRVEKYQDIAMLREKFETMEGVEKIVTHPILVERFNRQTEEMPENN